MPYMSSPCQRSSQLVCPYKTPNEPHRLHPVNSKKFESELGKNGGKPDLIILILALLLLLASPSHQFLFDVSAVLTCNTSAPPPAAASSGPPPLAPALFVIGDSSVDCGNNNRLLTFARADFPPYGRDFDTYRPTGRFSNGRLVVDFLANRLGLPLVPPYPGLCSSTEDMIRGVNYASGAAGIISTTGIDMGGRVSLSQQVQQVTDTISQFQLSLGEAEVAELVSKSVFYVSIGSNDFIHYYFSNADHVQSYNLPWEFGQILTAIFKGQLKKLYDVNVRKIVIMGLPPIGCAPHYLLQNHSQNGECVDFINDVVLEFNYGVKYMMEGFMDEFTNATLTFCDVFQSSMDIMANRTRYGFETVTDACCGWGEYRAEVICLPFLGIGCRDASKHVWWDQYHPTEAVNRILADNVWSGLHTNMCFPMNLEEMVTG